MEGWLSGSRAMTSESLRCNGHATVTESHQNRFQRSCRQSCDWRQIHSVADGSHCRSGAASLEVKCDSIGHSFRPLLGSLGENLPSRAFVVLELNSRGIL
jgi:hypothetical protein